MLLDQDQSVPADIRPRPARAFVDALPASLRRLFSGGGPASARDLPPELAFLSDQGVASHLLHAAARIAAATGVTGEASLFGLGFSDERYARLLARHLGVPHLRRPLPLAQGGVDTTTCMARGWAPLAPNPDSIAHVFAPHGAALRLLLEEHGPEDRGRYGFAVTTRRRFEALLRRHDAAGLGRRAASGLADWDATLSARGGATTVQRGAAVALLAAAVLGLGFAPAAMWTLLWASLFVLFTAAVALRLATVAAAGRLPPQPPPRRIPDRDLPVYTVVVPLFREAAVLPALLRNLDAIDYPPAKLDIKLMLEEGDHATVAALARLVLPARYDVVLLPDGHPRTKPRALNAALEAARGACVVVYDAEDRPDPGQLRAAAARFADGPPGLACLQARLTVDHADEAWITRMFALDYAALFHVVMPGLAALGLPIPLGGTSNHFRTAALRRIGGWDAWNVTEDIDLGYRLARFGFAVAALDSDTFEEAPLTLARWMPQRSRWMKGWMVTLIVHGRNPRRLFAELGWRSAGAVAVSLCGTVASCLVGVPLLAVAAIEAWCGTLFRAETTVWWLFVGASLALLVGGIVASLWPALLGLRRMGRLDLAPWLVSLPFYLLLVSAAGWRALYELWRDPQAWNKTEHGLARLRAEAQPLAASRPRVHDEEPETPRALTV